MDHSFYVSMHSVSDVEHFVALASVQPFDISVSVDSRRINGKSLMGIFSLDLNQPVEVRAECSEPEFSVFRQKVQSLPFSA